ncbi:MAG: radical SAM protein [Lachnospiraceae bacterium]|nr:radical SAM protein [Lachnospiraceae bacterium]
MDYEGQICRSPMERGSFMLPVSVGCSYNACRFCTLFKHLSFRMLPLDQIRDEIRRVRDLGGNPSVVYLGDGNAFGMEMERFRIILSWIHEAFPGCTAVNMDAAVSDIARKTDEELAELAACGVKRLYLGIESGLADVLNAMNKDHSPAEAVFQIDRLHRAGLIYDAHIMTGIAGAGRGEENARATADFLNRTRPGHLVNFSLFLHRSAPLYKDIENGIFHPAFEYENLLEDRLLLALLDVPGLKYDSFHDNLEFRVRGILPQDKAAMLHKLDAEIKKQEAFADEKPPVYH